MATHYSSTKKMSLPFTIISSVYLSEGHKAG
jgi:hypothetical protein